MITLIANKDLIKISFKVMSKKIVLKLSLSSLISSIELRITFSFISFVDVVNEKNDISEVIRVWESSGSSEIGMGEDIALPNVDAKFL